MVTIMVATAHKVLALFMRTSQTLGYAISPMEVKLFTSILKGPQLGQGHKPGTWIEAPSFRTCGSFVPATLS